MLESTKQSINVREFAPEDYERLAEVYNSIYPGYERPGAQWRLEDESLDRSKYYAKRYVALGEGSERALGFARIGHGLTTFHPKKFWISIFVDPTFQKKGVGGVLYDKLGEDLRDLGAVSVWGRVKEDMPDSIRFLTKRGFAEEYRAWESKLDLRQVDGGRHSEYFRKALVPGVIVSTLAQEMKSDPDWARKLYELVEAVEADMPQGDTVFTPLSFEQWQALELKSPNLLPEGYLIAKDGSRYVGVCVVWKHEMNSSNLWQGNTGVLREYRGKGIAFALKTRVIEFARQNNYRLIRTFNDSANAAMLGINMKLGFKRETGWITFAKNIA